MAEPTDSKDFGGSHRGQFLRFPSISHSKRDRHSQLTLTVIITRSIFTFHASSNPRSFCETQRRHKTVKCAYYNLMILPSSLLTARSLELTLRNRNDLNNKFEGNIYFKGNSNPLPQQARAESAMVIRLEADYRFF